MAYNRGYKKNFDGQNVWQNPHGVGNPHRTHRHHKQDYRNPNPNPAVHNQHVQPQPNFHHDNQKKQSDKDLLIAELRNQLKRAQEENIRMVQQRVDHIEQMEMELDTFRSEHLALQQKSLQLAEENKELLDQNKDLKVFSPDQKSFMEMTEELKELENEALILQTQRDQNTEKRVRLAELETAFQDNQTTTKMFQDANSLLVVNIQELEKENHQLKSQLQTASLGGDENEKLKYVDELRRAVEATQAEMQSFIDANCQLILENQQLQKENNEMKRQLEAASKQELLMKDLRNHLKFNVDEKRRLNKLLSEEAENADELREKETYLKNQEKELEAKIREKVEVEENPDLRNESQTHEEEKRKERNQCLDMEENEVMEGKEHEEKESEERIELLIEGMEEIPNDRETESANKVEDLNKCQQILQQETPKNVKKEKKQKKNNKEKKVKDKKKVEKVKEPKEKPEKRSSISKFFRRLFGFKT